MGRQRIVLVWQISLFPITSLGKQGAFSRANRKYGILSVLTPLCLRVRTRDVAKQNERTANMATQMTSDDRNFAGTNPAGIEISVGFWLIFEITMG